MIPSAGIGAGTRLRELVKALERRLSLFPSEPTSFRLDDDLVFDKDWSVLLLTPYRSRPRDLTANQSNRSELSQDPSSLDIVENEIRNLVLTTRELIPALNDEADAVQRAAARLRARDYRQINSLRPAVALPVEILANIFLLSNCGTAPDKLRKPLKPRLTILSVCHHWRIAALGTPDLWTLLSLRVERSGGRLSLEPAPQFLEWMLERASNRPLSLTISFHLHDHQTLELSDTILPLLTTALSQSGIVTLVIDTFQLDAFLPIRIPLPALTSITIERIWFGRASQVPMDLSQAPLLRHIGTKGVVPLLLPSPPPSSIQSVSLSDFEFDIDASSLSQLGSLRTLKQLKLGARKLPADFNGTLEFPELVKLAYTRELKANKTDPKMIHAIVAPKLRYLCLPRSADFPRRWQFPSLKYLEADAGHDLVDNLECFPEIEYLRFGRPSSSERPVLEYLCRLDPHGEPVFMPSLRVIECWFDGKHWDLMETLIKTRNRGEEERPGMSFSMKFYAYGPRRLQPGSFLAKHPFSTADARQSHVDWFALDELC